MSESLNPENETLPLSPELEGMLPETARLALLAEVMTGGVCTGFGAGDAEDQYQLDAYKLWSKTTGDHDPARFEADFRHLNQAIAARGGAEEVRMEYLAQKKQQK